MNEFQLILLVSCIASTVFGTAVLVRDFEETTNRLAAGIIYGGAFWAFCELIWSQANTPQTAMAWVKISAVGWVWIGPLGLHLMMELVGGPMQKLRVALKTLYGLSALYLVALWTSPVAITRMVRMDWGWSYEHGAIYPLYYAVTVSAIFSGLGLAWSAYRRWPSQAERRQARGIAVAILIPLVVASVTDGILPFLGIHVWHLGTASIALLGATVAITLHRYGYSLLSPGMFAREILETMSDGLTLLHLDGRIRHCNPALLQMAGCESTEELVGRHIETLIEGVDIFAPRVGREMECRFVPLEGTSFPVAISRSRLSDRQGGATGLVLIVHDLKEVVELRQRLVISGRMAAVGQLASGVAHELNNPMAYVRANLSLLQEQLSKLPNGDKGAEIDGIASGEWLEIVQESLEGIDRATSIVRDIKNFSHTSAGKRERIDIHSLLESTVRMAGPQIRHKVDVRCDYQPVPLLRCSPRQIQQVLLNLILNAADSAVDEERVTISLSTWSESGSVWIGVEDDGAGIEYADLERVFDPFFTTKAAGDGTGLGLSLSYEIMRSHGGEIRVESEPGRGTLFTLSLPAEAPEAITG
jgi:PAS domain S-box-containing protein